MEFVVPKLSATMEEAVVLKWLKRPGDSVKLGEPIVELETDKAAMEVEAPADGRLEAIVAEEGASVPIGGVLARIATDGAAKPAGAATAPAPAAAQPPVARAPAPSSAPAASKNDGRVLASPLARRLAAEHGLDLAGLSGSGPHGRIRRRDVLAAAEAAPKRAPAAASPPVAPPAASAEAGLQPLAPMRARIAESVAVSRRTIPSFALDRWVESRAIVKAREAFGRAVEQATGIKLTTTDFLLQAMADALAGQPAILDRWAERDGRPHRESPGRVNIGLVVAVSDGLLIPVIADAAGKSIGAIAELRRAAVQRARAGRLAAADAEPASIALSNLGRNSGIDRFEAIISPGQSSIVAVGREHERVVARGGAIAVAAGFNLTFSVDHRLIDGRAAANFLSALADRIEYGPWSAE